MTRHDYCNGAFALTTLGLGLASLSSAIQADYGWAWGLGTSAIFSGACWGFARQTWLQPESTPAQSVPVAEVDPVLKDINRQIAEAVRLKRRRIHLYRARDERMNALLSGGRA